MTNLHKTQTEQIMNISTSIDIEHPEYRTFCKILDKYKVKLYRHVCHEQAFCTTENYNDSDKLSHNEFLKWLGISERLNYTNCL